jgi:hypothetical protein
VVQLTTPFGFRPRARLRPTHLCSRVLTADIVYYHFQQATVRYLEGLDVTLDGQCVTNLTLLDAFHLCGRDLSPYLQGDELAAPPSPPNLSIRFNDMYRAVVDVSSSLLDDADTPMSCEIRFKTRLSSVVRNVLTRSTRASGLDLADLVVTCEGVIVPLVTPEQQRAATFFSVLNPNSDDSIRKGTWRGYITMSVSAAKRGEQ